MSKVLIVSDSHGLDRELTELKQRHRHEVDLMIHCGDSELYAGDEAIADFLVVRGNCDYERSFQNDIIAEFAGLRFFVTHGHRYSIKSSLLGASLQGRGRAGKCCLFRTFPCFGRRNGEQYSVY